MRWFQGKQEIIQVEIDTHSSGYTLIERTDRSTNEWANIVLSKGQKLIELGWNGTRLSNGRGAKDLIAHDPEVYKWAIDTLRAAEREKQNDL
jgi:hypothetical protein